MINELNPRSILKPVSIVLGSHSGQDTRAVVDIQTVKNGWSHSVPDVIFALRKKYNQNNVVQKVHIYMTSKTVFQNDSGQAIAKIMSLGRKTCHFLTSGPTFFFWPCINEAK